MPDGREKTIFVTCDRQKGVRTFRGVLRTTRGGVLAFHMYSRKYGYIRPLRGLLALCVLLGLVITVHGQSIYVLNQYGDPATISEYSISGAVINPSLVIIGNYVPDGMALSGSDVFVANAVTNSIGEYDANSGAAINTSLITGLAADAIAISGTNVFASIPSTGTIAEFTTSGALVNSSLISGLDNPTGITVSGTNIFVANGGSNTIGEYTTSGTLVNAALVSGLSNPTGITVSGANIFVANGGSNTIGEYTILGSPVNTALVSGLSDPAGIAIYGSDLFVTNASPLIHTVGEYDATSGAAINAALITAGYGPVDISISSIPEPSTYTAILGLAALGFVVICRRRVA